MRIISNVTFPILMKICDIMMMFEKKSEIIVFLSNNKVRLKVLYHLNPNQRDEIL